MLPVSLKGYTRMLRLAQRHPLFALRHLFLAHDYCSPTLINLPDDIELYFPNARRVMSFNVRVNHISREDKRLPGVGFCTWDEAAYLMNLSERFSHGRGLEIGCLVGWSTVCIALGGIQLDVIDPGLGSGPRGEAVRSSLRAAGVIERVNLIEGFSPEAVRALGGQGHRWSFCFVDGDHIGDAPKRDVLAVLEYCEPNCVIVAHDTSNRNIHAVIAILAESGWTVTFLYTAFGLGIAWRGKITPPEHIPDPAVSWGKIGLYPGD